MLKINRTIKLLMISDIFVVTGFGLVIPILAIFIKDNVVGGTIFTAGVASAIYLVTKCLVQLPFSKYVDKHDGRIKWLIIGTFIVASAPFIYMFANHIWHVFLAQIVNGIGSGLVFPTWLGLWSVSLDKDHESYEWSLYSTLVSLGSAGTATIGAAISEFLGFKVTFGIAGIAVLVGGSILFALERRRQNNGKRGSVKYHRRKQDRNYS